jgi:hypothetical protein
MSFAMAKGTGRSVAEETHLSVNMGGSLLLYDLKDPDNPLELAFQPKSLPRGAARPFFWRSALPPNLTA